MIDLVEKISAWDDFYDQNHNVLATRKKDFLMDDEIFDEDGNFLEDVAIKKYATPLPELSMDTLEEEFRRMRRKLHENKVIIDEHLGKAPLGFDSVSGLIERGEELMATQERLARMECDLLDSPDYRRIVKRNKELAAELRELKDKGAGTSDHDSQVKILGLETKLTQATKKIKEYKENPFADLSQDEITRIMRRSGKTEKIEKEVAELQNNFSELEQRYDSDIAEKDKKIEEISTGKDELTAENTGLKLEKDTLQNQIKELEEKEGQYDTNMKAAAEKIEQQNKEIAEKESEKSELETKLHDLSQKIKNLDQTFDDRIAAEIEKITGSEKDLASNIKELEKDIADLTSAKETAEAQIKKLTEDYDSALSDKESAEDEAGSLKEQMEDLRVKIADAEEKEKKYDIAIKAKEDETNSLLERNKALASELEKAKKDGDIDVDKINADAVAAAEKKYEGFVSPADAKKQAEDAAKKEKEGLQKQLDAKIKELEEAKKGASVDVDKIRAGAVVAAEKKYEGFVSPADAKKQAEDVKAAAEGKYQGQIDDLAKKLEEAKKSVVSDEDMQKKIDAAKEAGKQEAEQKYKPDMEKAGKLTKALQESKKTLEKQLKDEEEKRNELIENAVKEKIKELDKEGTIDVDKIRAAAEKKYENQIEQNLKQIKKTEKENKDLEKQVAGLTKDIEEAKKTAPVDEAKVRAELEKKYEGFVSPADVKKQAEDVAKKEKAGLQKQLDAKIKELEEAKKDASVDVDKIRADAVAVADKKYEGFVSPADAKKQAEDVKAAVEKAADDKYKGRIAGLEKDLETAKKGVDPEALKKEVDAAVKKEKEALEKQYASEKEGLQNKIDEQAEKIQNLKEESSIEKGGEIDTLKEALEKKDEELADKDRDYQAQLRQKDSKIGLLEGKVERRQRALDNLKGIKDKYEQKLDQFELLFDSLDVLADVVGYTIPTAKPKIKTKGLLAKIPGVRRLTKSYKDSKKKQADAHASRNVKDYNALLDYLMRHPEDIPAKKKKEEPAPVKVPRGEKKPDIIYIERPSKKDQDIETILAGVWQTGLDTLEYCSDAESIEDFKEKFYEAYVNKSGSADKRFMSYAMAKLANIKYRNEYYVDAVKLTLEAQKLSRESYEKTKNAFDKKQLDLLERNLQFFNSGKESA